MNHVPYGIFNTYLISSHALFKLLLLLHLVCDNNIFLFDPFRKLCTII